jgi:hypothetical protein
LAEQQTLPVFRFHLSALGCSDRRLRGHRRSDLQRLGHALADGVDAGVYWGYNKAFFFKGSDYCRYDCKTDTVDYIRPIVDFWPGLWPSGIEACLNWTNGKLYIFRGSEYVRWDIGFDRMDEGYPRAIAGAWNGICG